MNEESKKLSVKQFSRIKSNSSLKLDQKALKTQASYKAFGPKKSMENRQPQTTKNASKRNKSYDYYGKKKSSKQAKEKEYRRIKEYIQSKVGLPSQKANSESNLPTESSQPVPTEPTSNQVEESKTTMRKKKLSIEIPESPKEICPSIPGLDPLLQGKTTYLPRDIGPGRSVSVQNRTTTITQFWGVEDSCTGKEWSK